MNISRFSNISNITYLEISKLISKTSKTYSTTPSISIILEILHLIIPERGFELSDLFGNIIGVIPLSGMFGDVSVYKCDDESSYIEIQGTDSITSVNLSLKDGQGNIIDMKGETYTLEFLLKNPESEIS